MFRANQVLNREVLVRLFLAVAMLCVASVAHAGDIACVYGGRDGYCNKSTANGGRLDCSAMTAAMLRVSFNTMVRVTNKANGRSITVRITDPGPYVKGRVIDLTPAGAHALGFSGLAHVDLLILTP